MTNMLSGIKYHVSLEGVSHMDETNNLASHKARISHPVGRDDENEGFVGWALPTVFPVFMRLCWWAEPTLLCIIVKHFDNPNFCVIISPPSKKSGLKRSPLIHSYGYEYFGLPALRPTGQPVGCSYL